MKTDLKYTAKDFIGNELLYAIAKENVDLAKEIASEFGGQELYIIKWDTIQGRKERDIRNAYIVSQKNRLAGNNTLAKELNLSAQRIRFVYKKATSEKLK